MGDALAVRCSLCKAEPGEPCQTLGLHVVRSAPHLERKVWADRVARTAPSGRDPDQLTLTGDTP